MLTQRRAETNQSWLAWLRAGTAKPLAMLGLIERLDHVRAAGLDPARGHRVHQARLAQLVREAGRTTVQHVAGYERQRRHATSVAVALDLTASLTDQAINLFDRLIGTHVNLTGDYIWSAERPVTERCDGFRPLRAAPDTPRKAA